MANARKRKQEEEAERSRTDRELDIIERAARESISRDAAAGGKGNNTASAFPGRISFIINKRRGVQENQTVPWSGHTQDGQPEEEEEEEGAVLSEGDILGQYEVDGQVYLQGDYHCDILVPGTTCQAISSKDDDWRSARISQVRASRNPEKNEIVRKYDVVFDNDETTQRDLPARDIRLLAPRCPAPQQLIAARVRAEREAETAAKPGAWTSITRLIPLATPEEVIVKEEEASAAIATQSHQQIRGDDDAYAAANPYGGAYKGYVLDEMDGKCGASNTLGAKAKFKKRKKRPRK